MRTSALFDEKKLWIFRKLWYVRTPHGQGGGKLSQYGHFSDKGEVSIFRDFVRTSFMDRS